MAALKVEVLPGPFLELGEAPHWDVESQSLYYVCILSSTLHRYDWKEGKTYSASIEGSKFASFVIPVKGRRGEFVVGSGTRLVLVSWDGQSEKATLGKVLADLGPEEADHRFNDGKADAQGRLYAGTMLAEDSRNHFELDDGSLYRLEAGGQIVQLKSKVNISNGLTWSARTGKFYYIDSFAFDIKEYTVDAAGNLADERVLIKLKGDEAATEFIADGMTSDADGNLYVAMFAGSKIVKINPDSPATVVQEIPLPVPQVTSVAFGGPNLDVLFATTASKELSTAQEPPAGAVLQITGLGVRGTPMHEFVLP